MENPIDHSIDLGLVNYVKHPSNPNYIVYRFVDVNRATSFEEELIANNIWFEKSDEKKRGKHYFLFAVHKNDYKKTEQINFKVEAKHKKPFIPFKWLRYTVMIIGFGVLCVALIGYCHQKRKLAAYDDKKDIFNLEQKSE